MWSQNRRRTFIRKLSIDRFCGLGADSKSFLSAMFFLDYLIVFFFFLSYKRNSYNTALDRRAVKGIKDQECCRNCFKGPEYAIPFIRDVLCM